MKKSSVSLSLLLLLGVLAFGFAPGGARVSAQSSERSYVLNAAKWGAAQNAAVQSAGGVVTYSHGHRAGRLRRRLPERRDQLPRARFLHQLRPLDHQRRGAGRRLPPAGQRALLAPARPFRQPRHQLLGLRHGAQHQPRRGREHHVSYTFAAGTSMAALAAAGVAALIKQRFPGISLGALKNRLMNSADDEGKKGSDPFYGRGFVNARRAVTE